MKRCRLDKRKIILGITGSFGSGKTTVACIFKSYGAKIIDADKIAHTIIRPNTQVYRKIVNAFGKDILKKNKSIDRNKVGNIVFSNKKALKRLNRLMHLQIIRAMKKQIRALDAKLVVLDAPLLLEVGLKKWVDKLIVVKISKREEIKRLLKRTSLNKKEIFKRIHYQMPQDDKVRMADFVIDNSGTIENTRKQVNKIRRLLWKN